MTRHTALVLLLAACDQGSGTDTGKDGTSDSDTGPVKPQPAALVDKSGTCPDFSTSGNDKTMQSDGMSRSLSVWLPKGGTEGKPVVIVWHGLGDSATGISGELNLSAWAKSKDVIVIAPLALPNPVVGAALWKIAAGDDPTVDLTLYDDLRTCVVQELKADITRVASFGFSGGALWTTYLLEQRSDTMATAVIHSGGITGNALTPPLEDYATPKELIPVMTVDGGTNDKWPQAPNPTLLNFQQAMQTLEAGLEADHDVVMACEHNEGHTIPMDVWTNEKAWLLAHTYGEPSPYATGAVAVPSGCTISTN